MKLTLAVQWGTGEVTIRDIHGSGGIAQVSECVNVSRCTRRADRRFPELPLISFLEDGMKNTSRLCIMNNGEGKKKELNMYKLFERRRRGDRKVLAQMCISNSE